ncbi:hypothetical protein [Kibdelosporangium phytohabitans]|uniref:Uncharacterized protein n=1 Tax=Kibdelosporangium phytohabitans TaxID=860235 RepID=A0A0N9HN91_9PSEU|nr:hypothetical protein [Kibdelosporangium phytohabitans]ALG05784.1 hypothetical protein AOZ06_01560 [Kibdelosporangium phytohabitans]MBE1466211.1 hypothetical protein [Kibdelosporangium phytohabitans]
MCRAGGRRCPGNGVSTTKAHVNARQRLSRARKALDKALSGGDPRKVAAAHQKLATAEAAMDAVRQAHTHDTPAPERDVTPVEPDAPTPDLQARIYAAYRDLAVKKQEWIRLARVRAKLTGADKSEVDKVLLAMMRSQAIYLAPDSNRKVLTDADHDAAIMIGGEPKHLIAFDAEFDLDTSTDPAAANTSATPPNPTRTPTSERRAKRSQTGDVTPQGQPERPRRSRNPGGKPETEADTKFFDLRESGYTGPINEKGEAVTSGPAVEILQALSQTTQRRRRPGTAGRGANNKHRAEVGRPTSSPTAG